MHQTPKEILYSYHVGLTADLFPMRLIVGAKKHPQVRVMVANDRAVAFKAEGGKAEKIGDLSPVVVTKVDKRTWTIKGDEVEWTCVANGSCGCGSPLKRITKAEAFK